MEKKKSPKISDYPTHQSSPFFVIISNRTYVAKGKEQIVTNNETGEIGVYTPLGESKNTLHDDKPYVKLFKGNSALRMQMSDAGRILFDYIVEHLGIGEDTMYIPITDFLAFAGYSINSKYNYYKAIENLLDANIIARQVGTNSSFYINPNVVFNGDRTKLKNKEIINPYDARVTTND